MIQEAYLWWVRRLEAYSRRRNSDSLDPYLMTECSYLDTMYVWWLLWLGVEGISLVQELSQVSSQPPVAQLRA